MCIYDIFADFSLVVSRTKVYSLETLRVKLLCFQHATVYLVRSVLIKGLRDMLRTS